MATMLAKARTKLVLAHPFYATIILSLNTVYADTLPNGKPLWLLATNGVDLLVNSKNFEELTIDHAVACLVHEAEHVARLHPFRRGHRNPAKWNKAGDYVINDDMEKNHTFQLPDGVLRNPAFRDMATERVYNLLPDDNGGNGGDGGDDPLDNDVLDAPDCSDTAQTATKEMVYRAAMAAKALGKLPAHMNDLLDMFLPPKVTWQEELRDFMTDVSQDDFSFSRPNRRFIHAGVYLPGKAGDNALRSIGFLIDQSGSISDHELRQYGGEILAVIEECAPSRMVLAYCDTQVAAFDEFDSPTAAEFEKLQVKARGGTDMAAGVRWFEENHPDVSALVVLTDGLTPWPDGTSLNLLWAITTDTVAPVGRTIRVTL